MISQIAYRNVSQVLRSHSKNAGAGASPLFSAQQSQDLAVKVCGTCDKPSVLGILSAARQAGHNNLIIGCLVGITHASKEKMTNRQAADLIGYIRKTSFSMNQPVKIACVTHLRDADALIGMIHDIEQRVLDGKSGLKNTVKQASKSLLGRDALSLIRLPIFDVIQIHDDMALSEIAKVKSTFPQSVIYKALHIPKRDEPYNIAELTSRAIDLAKQSCIDGLLLDSSNLKTNQIGGTGLVNNWQVARIIIDAVHRETGKEVALAGGLTPDNMQAAIETTGADMVDANSGYRFDRIKQSWDGLDPRKTSPKDPFAVYKVLLHAKASLERKKPS